MKKLTRGLSQKYYDHAKTLIPGGTQILSKRPELFLPNHWPAYYTKAKGIKIWDLDNRTYRDFTTNGVGACLHGYANNFVDQRVKQCINDGSMASLNSFEEVQLAEKLLELHPECHMARFAKTGGEACAIAVRIARAATKKDIILFCGYHGWHDWYLSSNLEDSTNLNKQLLSGLSPNGVPANLINSTSPFDFNDTAGLKKAFKQYNGRIAAIIMEPIRSVKPNKDFIDAIHSLSKKEKSLLIIDEVTSGFRENIGGYHLKTNLKPDMIIFGKGIANGYPISAVIGKEHAMNAAKETFISSTFFSERIGFVAALASIELMEKKQVQKKLIKTGKAIKKCWSSAAKKAGIKINISGIDPLATFAFADKNKSLEMMTFYIQEMLNKGFLAGPSFYANYAVTDRDIGDFSKACEEIFKKIANHPNIESSLLSDVKHTTFQRLN